MRRSRKWSWPSDPAGPVPGHHHLGAHRGAGPGIASGVAPDRVSGPVQQGGGGPQRLRPRVGHPPARRARRSLDLRDHRRCQRGPGGQPDRAGQALGPPRLRRQLDKMGVHVQATGSTRLSPGSRSSPTARWRSPRPTSRPSWPRSWARTLSLASSSRRSRWRRARSGCPGPGSWSADRGQVEASAEGNGMIDAACTAIRRPPA